MRWIRRLYDWVLSLAERPHGTMALFLLSFAESSVFPIPPDPLLIALCLGKRSASLFFGAVCTLGSVLGGLFGYLIGWGFWDWSRDFFFRVVPGFSPEIFQAMQVQYETHSFWIVFTAGFTPIPYKVFTVSSGVFAIPLLGFFFASLIGRALRFFLVAYLIGRYGARLSGFIDRYFNQLTVLFTVLLILGFFAARWMIH